jgi:hypothetical protein
MQLRTATTIVGGGHVGIVRSTGKTNEIKLKCPATAGIALPFASEDRTKKPLNLVLKCYLLPKQAPCLGKS